MISEIIYKTKLNTDKRGTHLSLFVMLEIRSYLMKSQVWSAQAAPSDIQERILNSWFDTRFKYANDQLNALE